MSQPPVLHRRSRGTLATRIMLTTTVVAVIAGLLTATIGAGLIRSSSDRSARAALKRVANAAQNAVTDRSGQVRVRDELRALKVQFVFIGKNGGLVGHNTLAHDSVTPGDIKRLLAGQSISARRTVDGSTVFLEARSTANGGFVLVQRRSDALGFGPVEQRRLVVAVLIGVVVAAAVGALVAAVLARPLRRTAAAARALAAGHRDVTVQPGGPAEIADVSTAVNQLSESLSYSEGRQRDFLLSVSHDLRTPLTSIRGYAESVADGVAAGPDAQRAAAVILAESHRLERLVADLLDLARLGAADFRIDLGPVELGAFLDGVSAAWEPRCAKEGIRFLVERPVHPVQVVTDGMRLRQAVDGLLENALRVVPSGAVIIVGARSGGPSGPGAGGVLEVRDGGPGLSDEDLSVAFEQGALFERYRGVRAVGTGLGLAIVAGLVRRLGAGIEAGHAAEGGARFTISLPPRQGSESYSG